MFFDCLFPAKRSATDGKLFGQPKKVKKKESFRKKKVSSKTVTPPIEAAAAIPNSVPEEYQMVEYSDEGDKDYNTPKTVRFSDSTTSLQSTRSCESFTGSISSGLSSGEPMEVHFGPVKKTTVFPMTPRIPRKLCVDVDNLRTGLVRAKASLRHISPQRETPLSVMDPPPVGYKLVHDRLAFMSGQLTPPLVDTPIRHLPVKRLLSVRRRLFQEGDSTSQESLNSIQSERTQTNSTVSSSMALDVHDSMDSPVPHTPHSGSIYSASSCISLGDHEVHLVRPYSPLNRLDKKPEILDLASWKMDGLDANKSQAPKHQGDMADSYEYATMKSSRDEQEISLDDKSDACLMNGGVGDICSFENSQTDTTWSDSRTPEMECDEQLWNEKFASRRYHRNRSCPRILFHGIDLYAEDDADFTFGMESLAISKKINRRLSFSAKEECA